LKNLLNINNLSVEYFRDGPPLKAIDNFTLPVNEGETVGVVGESGCGKSTMALAIMGLILPGEGRVTGGTIDFDGKQLLTRSRLQWQALRGKEISMIFQDPFTTFNPVATIGSQIRECIAAHQQNISRTDSVSLVHQALTDARLPDPKRIYSSFPHQLSGGQLQRAAIALALCNAPKLLIADEPTTALDVTIQHEIMDLLDLLKAEHNLTIIFITHNLPLARERCQKIAVMRAGRLVEYADKESIFSRPQNPYTVELIKAVPKLMAAKQ
jgi:ABC-type dipeptide/oligopeptide/nickel transport system ATPase component